MNLVLEDLKKLRQQLNELEENHNEKKRQFKFEFKLMDDHKEFENFENLDPENVDIEFINKVLPNSTDNDLFAKIKKQLNPTENDNLGASVKRKSMNGLIIQSDNEEGKKSRLELELERKRPKPMEIDLELQ